MGVSKLLLAVTAGDQSHRLETGLPRGLDVPWSVADHHRVVGPGAVEGGADKVGLRLGRLDVVVGRPRIHELAGVEEIEVVVDLLLRRRARQDRREPPRLQVDDQISCALQRLDLADQLTVELVARVANPVSLLLVRLLADEGGNQLVPAHADVPVDAPERQHDSVAPERPVPRERVVVVRVDQGADDVEQRSTRSWFRSRHVSSQTGISRGGQAATASKSASQAMPGRGTAYLWIAACVFSAASSCLPSANSSTIFALNAGRSSGFRLETRPASTTTSLSTQFAPALARSVCRLGQLVISRPLTTPASIKVHGP